MILPIVITAMICFSTVLVVQHICACCVKTESIRRETRHYPLP